MSATIRRDMYAEILRRSVWGERLIGGGREVEM